MITASNPETASNLDYIKDGLVYCYKCNTPKQCIIAFPDKARTVSCLCACEKTELGEVNEKNTQAQARDFVKKLKKNGIHDNELLHWTFAMDNGSNKDLIILKNYAIDFKTKFYPRGAGLLFWGDVGTGKTFAAACIANALIENGVPVLMTSVNKVINEVFDAASKTEYFQAFDKYDLLIIDDLGADRKTDYAMEQVYNVIDDRYKSGKPLIITTNLSVNELKNPQNIAYSRIYDRILEKCTPIAFHNKNYRKEKRSEQIEFVKNELGRRKT
jgi:DNA replication protein DnaC